MINPALHNFESAGQAVIAFLHKRLGFDLWMVTRTEGDNWIVLQREDRSYNIGAGVVFSWADSFCSRMVKGEGPRVAPSSKLIAPYAAAGIGRQIQIGAYVGVPLTKADGSLFGTLCAIDPQSQPETIAQEQDLVELLADLLSTVLQADLRAADAARLSERFEQEAHTDPLTQLFNRRAWDQLLAKEEARCRRYGHAATVLAVDLDGLKRINDSLGHAAGDDLIVRAAHALRKAARGVDVVARLGGDEFAILALECDLAGAQALLQRARAALADAQVPASLGMAVREHAGGLTAALETADGLMYQEKRSR
jgi:diguanylate cyclase